MRPLSQIEALASGLLPFFCKGVSGVVAVPFFLDEDGMPLF